MSGDAHLRWCQKCAGGYPGIGNAIKNFKMDFRNGLVWCAMLASFDPSCLDYASLKSETEADMLKNHALAFSVAEKRFKVEPVLDAEDMLATAVPDQRSVLLYVSQMFKVMKDLPYENPYARVWDDLEFAAQRKKMEEERLAKQEVTRTPPPQKIVKGKGLNDGADEIPDGPCGKCQRDNNFPLCKKYEFSELRKGKCLGCHHTPAEHGGFDASLDSASNSPAPKPAPAPEPVDPEREERRRRHREEMAELDRIDAAKRGNDIEAAANALTDFLSPRTAKQPASIHAGADEKAPDGPCGKCQRENAYPQCEQYEASKTRKGKCVTCLHSPSEHAGYVKQAAAAAADTKERPQCPECREPLSGACAVFNGRELHQACFVCAGGCGKGLAGKRNVVAVASKAYCDLCAVKAFAAAQPKQPAAQADDRGERQPAAQPKQPPARADDRERQQRLAARRERRRELVREGIALGIVPAAPENQEKRLDVLRKQMKQRKATRKAPPPDRWDDEAPAAAAATAPPPQRVDNAEREAEERAEERRKQRERERADEDKAEKEREERRKQREREREEEGKAEKEREERRKQRERDREEDARKEREGAAAAAAAERERAEERDREERRKQREDEERKRSEAEAEAAAAARRQEAPRPAATSPSGEAETTVDLSEKDPEKLLQALDAKGESNLSPAEARARKRALLAIERKKEEEAFEREMEERRKAREERRRQREQEGN